VNVYPFIEAENASGNVKRACELLQVSRSACYTRRTADPSARERADAALTEKIIAVHDGSNGTCGTPRVHAELADLGQRPPAIRCTTRFISQPSPQRASQVPCQWIVVPSPGTGERSGRLRTRTITGLAPNRAMAASAVCVPKLHRRSSRRAQPGRSTSVVHDQAWQPTTRRARSPYW
jgi:hypothetical protein